MWQLTGTSYNAQEKIWSGPAVKQRYSNEMTVGEAVTIQLQKTPQKIIQIMGSTGETLTAQKFLQHSRTLARHLLLDMGIKAKDIVGLYAQNSRHVATVMMASFLCGAPVNALFPGFEKQTVTTLYGNTRPKLIFCDEDNYQNALEANEDLKLDATIILMTGLVEGVTHIKDLLKERATNLLISEFPCTKLNSSDTVAILCSSGTTGTPKGVMTSHQALLHSNVYLTSTTDSVLLCFSTMYWASGLLNLVSSLLNSNLRIVPDKPYTPEFFLYLVKRYKITHVLSSSNQMAELVLKLSKEEIRKSLSSINTLLCGGSKVPQPVQEKLWEILVDNRQRPGLGIIYGMSEIMGGLSCNAGYPFEFQSLSEGKLWCNKQVCIIDKNGRKLGPNETGEILIYNPYMWLGYYNNPQATAKALSGKWLHSGDMGYIDDLGFLHVRGRAKDMFKWKNFQICPQPIEDVILTIPGVAEVCVFPIPDLLADNLAACAIIRMRNLEGRQLTEDLVQEFLQRNMDSHYHMRGGVYFLDVLPKTGSGKIRRHEVAELINAKIENCQFRKQIMQTDYNNEITEIKSI